MRIYAYEDMAWESTSAYAPRHASWRCSGNVRPLGRQPTTAREECSCRCPQCCGAHSTAHTTRTTHVSAHLCIRGPWASVDARWHVSWRCRTTACLAAQCPGQGCRIRTDRRADASEREGRAPAGAHSAAHTTRAMRECASIHLIQRAHLAQARFGGFGASCGWIRRTSRGFWTSTLVRSTATISLPAQTDTAPRRICHHVTCQRSHRHADRPRPAECQPRGCLPTTY